MCITHNTIPHELASGAGWTIVDIETTADFQYLYESNIKRREKNSQFIVLRRDDIGLGLVCLNVRRVESGVFTRNTCGPDAV